MSRHGAAFDRAQAAYDAMLPPEYDEPECSDCGGLLEIEADHYKCAECGRIIEIYEPDYD